MFSKTRGRNLQRIEGSGGRGEMGLGEWGFW